MKKKIVQSSIYSNVLSCLVTRGIHYQCLLLRQTVTWNMSMQKHFKYISVNSSNNPKNQTQNLNKIFPKFHYKSNNNRIASTS